MGRNLGAPLPDMVLYQKFSAWIHPMDIDRVVKRYKKKALYKSTTGYRGYCFLEKTKCSFLCGA